MATQYRHMNGNEFLRALSQGETDLQRIALPEGTDFSKIETFDETMGALRQRIGYRPDLSGLITRQLTAYDREYDTSLYLPHAILSGADLEGADLREAKLGGADLKGAKLEGASLERARLGEADLRGASLLGAKLEGASLEGAYLRGADLREAKLEGANFMRADLSYVVHATAEQLSMAFLRHIRTDSDNRIKKLVKQAYRLQGEYLFKENLYS